MTPNSEGSQDEDDCSSLFGCMTSAGVSCLSGETSSQQQTQPCLNGETPPIQSSNTSGVGQGHLSRNTTAGVGGSSKNSGKRSKEQKTTRVCHISLETKKFQSLLVLSFQSEKFLHIILCLAKSKVKPRKIIVTCGAWRNSSLDQNI